MGKRGRPRTVIQLTTGNDPSLWKYDSLSAALQANIDILAALVENDMKPTEETPGVDQVRTAKRPMQEQHDDQTDVYGNVAL